MKSKLIKNYPIEEYHKNDGSLSTSRLKLMLNSPLSFRYPINSESTEAQNLGSAIHVMLLEPNLFKEQFFVYDAMKRPFPESTFAKKENKAWLLKIKTENEGKIFLTAEEKKECEDATKNILKDPIVIELLEGSGWNEASIYWTDFKRKVDLKARPDRLRANMIIIDVKTAIDASPEGFSRAIGKYRYDIQAAMQIDGVEAHFKKKVPYYFYLAIEKKPPYNYGIYLLDEDTIWTGRNTYKLLLDIVNECRKSDVWQSYSYWAKNTESKTLKIGLPNYIKTNLFQTS